MKTVEVALGDRSYTVFAGEGLIEKLGDLLEVPANCEAIFLIADRAVAGLYGERTVAVLESAAPRRPVHVLEVAQGETSKSLASAGHLLEKMAEMRARRDDLVVTLGGGMVSDLGGFVASVYNRGIGVAHLPTTLVGQVDAAIGGKTGVNLAAGKNLAGTFHQPLAVVADISTLETLGEREFRSGLAEVVKCGFALDPELVDLLESGMEKIKARDPGLLEEVVARCAELKVRIVVSDEFDQGGRAVLNYGHTFGHALEAAGGYQKWLHGEAVAVGLAFAARLSVEQGLLDDKVAQRQAGLLAAFGLPVSAEFDPGEVKKMWASDKKHRGKLHWVLLTEPGETEVTSKVGEAAIEKALEAVRA
jgi:3-dehydroquinate synthase